MKHLERRLQRLEAERKSRLVLEEKKAEQGFAEATIDRLTKADLLLIRDGMLVERQEKTPTSAQYSALRRYAELCEQEWEKWGQPRDVASRLLAGWDRTQPASLDPAEVSGEPACEP